MGGGRKDQFQLRMGRGSQLLHQRLARLLPLQTPVVFGRDDNDFVSPMHGDMLRPFAAHAPNQFAETALGIL